MQVLIVTVKSAAVDGMLSVILSRLTHTHSAPLKHLKLQRIAILFTDMAAVEMSFSVLLFYVLTRNHPHQKQPNK